MRSALLGAPLVALALLFSPVSQQSAQAQVLGALKASAADSGNLVTQIRRGGGGGRGGISRGGGRGHIARGGGGRGYVARGGRGRYAGNIGRYHGGNRYYGKYHGKYYGNRYYGHRRYGYWPWIGVGAYRYGSTNCDWLYRHNYRRWLAVCQ